MSRYDRADPGTDPAYCDPISDLPEGVGEPEWTTSTLATDAITAGVRALLRCVDDAQTTADAFALWRLIVALERVVQSAAGVAADRVDQLQTRGQ